MASISDDTLAWVASKTIDGEWHRAKVVTTTEDGTVTLETLDEKEMHTALSEVRDNRHARMCTARIILGMASVS